MEVSELALVLVVTAGADASVGGAVGVEVVPLVLIPTVVTGGATTTLKLLVFNPVGRA